MTLENGVGALVPEGACKLRIRTYSRDGWAENISLPAAEPEGMLNKQEIPRLYL